MFCECERCGLGPIDNDVSMGSQWYDRHASDVDDVLVHLHHEGRLDLLSGKYLGWFGLNRLEEFTFGNGKQYGTDDGYAKFVAKSSVSQQHV